MKPGNRIFKEIPLEIVGSSKFGRYQKISVEQTWNQIISDGWSVPYAGYKQRVNIANNGQGRGLFSSQKLNRMFTVINNDFFVITPSLDYQFVGSINTFIGDVWMAGNNADQIALSDGQAIYIYDANAGTFTNANVPFTPGFITFQNGRFLSPDLSSNNWQLSAPNNGLSWPGTAAFVGTLQTKPDNTQAVISVPGAGNLIFVMGKTVTEPWFDVGARLFPYQRSTSFNIDYGCLSPATIAEGDKFVVWLGFNEKSGVALMVSNGGVAKQISTDGINFQLANLTNPTNSYGFLFKQDGHLLYQFAFPDDNISYVYDFNTDAFFNVSDPTLNYHIAKRVVFFNNKYYFISFVDGNIYELSSSIYSANGLQIPRVRVCKNIRLPDQSRFILANVGFTMEQGTIAFDDRDTTFNLTTEDGTYITTENGNYIGGGQDFSVGQPRVDLRLSKDGGYVYGSDISRPYHALGRRKNRMWFLRLGFANDAVCQFNFYGFGRFLATNGIAAIYS